jgi:uncharacterized protein GlcG (DUF336 family)
VNLVIAQDLLDACLVEARRLGRPMTLAVCDAGGHLLAFARMDGCPVIAADTAPAKARTAIYFQRPTTETVERSRTHPTVYSSFVDTASAPIVLSMGGIPLWRPDGALVGAVAAAGGTGEEDDQVAEAGVARWHQLADDRV